MTADNNYNTPCLPAPFIDANSRPRSDDSGQVGFFQVFFPDCIHTIPYTACIANRLMRLGGPGFVMRDWLTQCGAILSTKR